MISAKKIEALKRTELFAPLFSPRMKDLPAVGWAQKLSCGEILFSAGEEAKGLYVVVRGSLSSHRENSEGREQVILVQKAGTTVGEVPVFDNKPYHSTVMADEESEVLFIPKEEVKRLCSRHSEVALAALRLLSARFREAAALAESLSLKAVDQRLAAFLLREFREKGRKEVRIPTGSAIAVSLGSVREVVCRAFAKLEGEKFIASIRKHYVILLDREGLTNFADSGPVFPGRVRKGPCRPMSVFSVPGPLS